MARKKKTSTSKELVSQSDWEKQLANLAEDQSSRSIAQVGAFLSIKNGQFTYQGADLGTELDVIVLDFVYEHTYYDTPYSKDNPSTPACFAISKNPGEMMPCDSSPKPQDSSCDDCENYKWGSAEGGGRGKACGEHRRLALVAYDDLDSNPEDIEIVMLSVPTTSCKNFDKFVKGVEKTLKRPTLGVVCTISFDEDADWEVLKFKAKEPMNELSYVNKILTKRDEASTPLLQEYDASSYIGDTKPAKKGHGKKKADTKPEKKKGKAKRKSKFSK